MTVADRYRPACRPHDSGCRGCGQTITPGRAYCSVACSDWFQQNHFWLTARGEALRRACSTQEHGAVEHRAICTRCHAPAKTLNYTTTYGRAVYWAPEVHHLVPLAGVRPTFGCCHHQENLIVLCHACHVQVHVELRQTMRVDTTAVTDALVVSFDEQTDALVLPFNEQTAAMHRHAAIAATLFVRVPDGDTDPEPEYCP